MNNQLVMDAIREVGVALEATRIRAARELDDASAIVKTRDAAISSAQTTLRAALLDKYTGDISMDVARLHSAIVSAQKVVEAQNGTIRTLQQDIETRAPRIPPASVGVFTGHFAKPNNVSVDFLRPFVDFARAKGFKTYPVNHAVAIEGQTKLTVGHFVDVVDLYESHGGK